MRPSNPPIFVSYCIGLRIADTHEAMRTVKSCNEMVVCGHPHPPKYNRQSLPPGQKEDSMDSHENHHAWASTTGDAIERHTNKKKKRKVPKERKENL